MSLADDLKKLDDPTNQIPYKVCLGFILPDGLMRYQPVGTTFRYKGDLFWYHIRTDSPVRHALSNSLTETMNRLRHMYPCDHLVLSALALDLKTVDGKDSL